jgi:hypothetical protein
VLPDSSMATTAAPAAPNFVRKMNITPIVVDYWTDANDWWVTASLDQTPMIEIGFFGGREEPELFVRTPPTMGSLFSNDVITYKIRHIYGGGGAGLPWVRRRHRPLVRVERLDTSSRNRGPGQPGPLPPKRKETHHVCSFGLRGIHRKGLSVLIGNWLVIAAATPNVASWVAPQRSTRT